MRKPVVVVVDDQSFICSAIDAILKGTYEIHTFLSGKEAMRYLSEHTADIVLLDYDMPEMTGYEVLMDIRISKLNGKTPVIFLTGQTNERMKSEMIERGASDYICKPVNASVLHQSVKKHLKGIPV